MIHSAIKMGHTLLKNVKVISLEPGVREVTSVSGKRIPRTRARGKRGCGALVDRWQGEGEERASVFTLHKQSNSLGCR